MVSVAFPQGHGKVVHGGREPGESPIPPSWRRSRSRSQRWPQTHARTGISSPGARAARPPSSGLRPGAEAPSVPWPCAFPRPCQGGRNRCPAGAVLTADHVDVSARRRGRCRAVADAGVAATARGSTFERIRLDDDIEPAPVNLFASERRRPACSQPEPREQGRERGRLAA